MGGPCHVRFPLVATDYMTSRIGSRKTLVGLNLRCGKRRIKSTKHSMNLQGATDACVANKIVDDAFVLDHNEAEQFSIIGHVSAEPMHLTFTSNDSVERDTGVPCCL